MADNERISLKKQTSRISLEAALSLEEAPAEVVAGGVSPASPPSTIRIKRPGKTGTEPPSPDSTPFSEQPTLAKSQTSKIEVAPSSIPSTENEGQTTQRKTIRIRRPDGASGPTIHRASGGGRAAVRIVKDAAGSNSSSPAPGGLYAPSSVEEASTPESPLTPRQKTLRLIGNIIFSAVASFAVIVSGAVIYFLTLQKYDW